MKDFWDPDIASLTLTPEEKNGLQVFRNYSGAFERDREKKFVEQLDSKTYDIDELLKVIEHILAEEARALPVIACAFADDVMLAMLRREIPDGVPGGKAGLWSGFGPLSRLSSRIQICYAFGWIDQELLREIDALRKIRNDISHKWDIAALRERIDQFVSSVEHPIEAAFDTSGRAPEGFSRHLELADRLRLRIIWILGRLFYECLVWVPALKAGLMPQSTLYVQHRPKLLVAIADACMKASKRLPGAS